jgi:hypothetical protein
VRTEHSRYRSDVQYLRGFFIITLRIARWARSKGRSALVLAPPHVTMQYCSNDWASA